MRRIIQQPLGEATTADRCVDCMGQVPTDGAQCLRFMRFLHWPDWKGPERLKECKDAETLTGDDT
jgi:hypothetical protein